MKRFLITVFTNWVGEENEFAAYAENDKELDSIASERAYLNFSDFGGFDAVLDDMFPEVVDGDYTEEQIIDARDREGDYYSYTINEWDESRPEEEWSCMNKFRLNKK